MWYPRGTHGLYDDGDRKIGAVVPAPLPNANIVVREHRGQPFYEAKFRHNGQQVKRRIGPAWLERDPATGA